MSDHFLCDQCGATGGEDSKCTCRGKPKAVCSGCGAVLGDLNSVCKCKPPWPSVEVRRNANKQTVSIRDLNAGQRCMVHGRMLKKPTATLTVCQDGVASIRVDDDANDEFWLTVELTREQVNWLHKQMQMIG